MAGREGYGAGVKDNYLHICFCKRYCFAKGKRCIGYKTDARSFIDGFDNVMLSGAPEVVLRNENELRDYMLKLKTAE